MKIFFSFLSLWWTWLHWKDLWVKSSLNHNLRIYEYNCFLFATPFQANQDFSVMYFYMAIYCKAYQYKLADISAKITFWIASENSVNRVLKKNKYLLWIEQNWATQKMMNKGRAGGQKRRTRLESKWTTNNRAVFALHCLGWRNFLFLRAGCSLWWAGDWSLLLYLASPS